MLRLAMFRSAPSGWDSQCLFQADEMQPKLTSEKLEEMAVG